MVEPSTSGLLVASLSDGVVQPQRWAIRCIHNAPDGLADILRNLWDTKGWQQAWHILASADIVVTNTGDKRSQLLKLPTLHRSVQRIMLTV